MMAAERRVWLLAQRRDHSRIEDEQEATLKDGLSRRFRELGETGTPCGRHSLHNCNRLQGQGG